MEENKGNSNEQPLDNPLTETERSQAEGGNQQNASDNQDESTGITSAQLAQIQRSPTDAANDNTAATRRFRTGTDRDGQL